MVTEILGTCDPAFNPVRDTLQESFAGADEVGEAVAVWAGGQCVLDLWAGHRDAARSQPWQEDSMRLHVFRR